MNSARTLTQGDDPPELRVHHDAAPHHDRLTIPVAGDWDVIWWEWPQWQALAEAERAAILAANWPDSVLVYEGIGVSRWTLVSPLPCHPAAAVPPPVPRPPCAPGIRPPFRLLWT